MTVSMSDLARAIRADQAAQDAASDFSGHIARWSDLYACKPVEIAFEFAEGTYRRERRSLGMAKQVCQDWASLCWSEKVEILAGEDESPTRNWLAEKFPPRFHTRFSEWLEGEVFQGGNGALEVLIEDMVLRGERPDFSKARLSVGFVPATSFIPLEWDDESVTSAAFATVGKRFVDVRVHTHSKAGAIIQYLRFVNANDTLGARIPDDVLLESGILPMLLIEGAPKLFAHIRPQIANNLAKNSPYGISVFANAESQLDAVDTCFDNFVSDVVLGARMVFVPETMLRTDDSGRTIPPQRDKKQLFVSLNDATGEMKHGIHEYAPALRVEENERALNLALSLMATKCAMGEESYRYRDGSIATATQIISENAELYRNRTHHLLNIVAGVKDIVRALLWCQYHLVGDKSIDPEAEVTVKTDDSIIEDDGARQKRGMEKVTMGVMSLHRYLVEYEGMAPEDADAEVARIEAVKTPELV